MFWLSGKNNERNKALDFWRAIAIILVLFRHAPISNDANFIFLTLQKGGWVGVDIFFVLRGFLVSGLLFKEFKLKKHIDIKRFLIRRAFKIYPSFYLFSLIYLLYSALFKQTYFNFNQIIGELFFIQNYLAHIHPHTWSLAVEEHFYLFLPIYIRFFILKNINLTLIIFISLIVAIRILSVFYVDNYENLHYLSHLRFDSLFIGVYLQYLYLFKITLLKKILNNNWLNLIFISILPLPFFIELNNIFLPTIGYSLIYLSYAFLIGKTLFIQLFKKSNLLLSISTIIGLSSYNIYLWHFQSRNFLERFFAHIDHTSDIIIIFTYILISCIIGILITFFFENYFLKIRERLTFSKK